MSKRFMKNLFLCVQISLTGTSGTALEMGLRD